MALMNSKLKTCKKHKGQEMPERQSQLKEWELKAIPNYMMFF